MRITALVILLLVSTAPSAHAQDLVAVPDREVRLDVWLNGWSAGAESSRILTGATAVGGGALLAALGAWWMVDAAPGSGDVYALLFVAATIDIAIGITRLVVPSGDELRLARWNAARREATLDGEELAAFEGELRGEAQAAAQARHLEIGLGIALVAAGAVGLGLTAALGRDDLAWGLGYAGSGLGILMGGILALTSMFESAREQEWDAYRRGYAPRPASVSVTPMIGPTLVGLGADGSF